MRTAFIDLEKRMELLNKNTKDAEQKLLAVREEAAQETKNPAVIFLSKELNVMKGN